MTLAMVGVVLSWRLLAADPSGAKLVMVEAGRYATQEECEEMVMRLGPQPPIRIWCDQRVP